MDLCHRFHNLVSSFVRPDYRKTSRHYRKTGRLRQFLFGACVPIVTLLGPSIGHEANASDKLTGQYTARIAGHLETFCTGCHSADAPEADVRLEYSAEALNIAEQHEVWRRAAAKLRSGEMPPEDEPQPTKQERGELIAWLDAAVASVDCRQISQPGRVTVRRLNRTEYNNTVRDLVGTSLRPADDFPADDVGNGFDNMADVLTLPPLLMEMYLVAAEQIVDDILNGDERACQRVIIARPGRETSEEQAARRVIETFAKRAFRRPVSTQETERLMRLYEDQAARGTDYPANLSLPLTAILVSPHFLFRIEQDTELLDDQRVRQLTDHELATRLSYFVWSSMPDAQLMAQADRGELNDPETLEQEVTRMLADDKAAALVDNFFGQWFQLRQLAKINPDPERFPSFDESLREAMLQETKLFLAALVRDDRSVLELLDSKYTFVNEQLAEHYGIQGVRGDQFRRVSLREDDRRGGLLTQASILTLTSNPTRTSPVKRGKWILENILGTPPPPPPPGVEELSEGDETELLGSLRERMEQHRADPSCAVCHKKMDALGFGFENFNAIGAWREKDGRFKINPAGSLPGDQQFSGPGELRKILQAERQSEFLNCLAEKTLTYALGRELHDFDRCAIDEIVETLKRNEYRFSALVLAVIQSEPFRMRGFRGENTDE